MHQINREVTAGAVREELSDLLGLIKYTNERIAITKHGRPVAVMMSVEDYKRLQALEEALGSH